MKILKKIIPIILIIMGLFPWIIDLHQNFFLSFESIYFKIVWTIFFIFGLPYLLMPLTLTKRIVDLKEENTNQISKLEEKIKKIHDINFLISIDSVLLNNPSPPFSSGIILEASIANKGLTASVATDWKLEAITPNGTSVKASFIPHSLRDDFDFKLSNKSINVKSQNALEIKTENNPIQGGGKERGFLTFSWTVPKDQIEHPETKLILSANDQCGKTHYTEKMIKELGSKTT